MNQSNHDQFDNDQKFLSRLTTLFLLAAEGMISESQFKQLNQLLIKNPVARDYYYDFIASYASIKSLEMFAETDDCRADYLNQYLAELARDQMHSPTVEVEDNKTDELHNMHVQKHEVPKYTLRLSRSSVFSFIASAAALLFIVLFVHFAPVRSTPVVGKCINTINTTGQTVMGEVVSGCDLYAGPVTLTKGLAEIELNGGTNIIVEAPAEFILKSASRIHLQQGRMVVKINGTTEEPFVVSSANASVVDYGTEFGVQVDNTGNTLTHVYQGKVELRTGSDPLRYKDKTLLVRDQGGLATPTGQLIPQKTLSGLFVRQNEFNSKILGAKGSAYHRWLAYSYRLRRDPSLVAYYTFQCDQSDPAILTNMANSTAGMLNGALASANQTTLPTWTKGRWPQTTALSFDRADMQYIEVPSNSAININGPITIAAWVDCSGAKDGGHILSNRVVRSTCNYQFGYRSPAMPGWRQGMHLARKTNSQDSSNQMCSKVLPPAVGWTLLAVTHDNDTLKFYMNGQLIQTKDWPYQQELAEGGLMIGSDFSPDDPSRFNGKMAEIVIAKRVFTEEEVDEMYKAGKP